MSDDNVVSLFPEGTEELYLAGRIFDAFAQSDVSMMHAAGILDAVKHALLTQLFEEDDDEG